MTPSPLRSALRVALALAVLPLLPAAAQASTWTVDDDRAQCPGASYTSIQAAVDQAAPHDTIIICDGLYQEQSVPWTATPSPAQTGSRNGLTITKPLTLKGTGAGKVFIEPHPALGASLAGTAPFLRDGGGNVITVARQSLGAGDEDENLVEISGVTVRSPHSYVEAGIAYFNTSGTVKSSVVGPLQRTAPDLAATRPHGWGIVQTNSLQGVGAGTVYRKVAVEDSLVTGYQAGGILFDGARGADGTPETLTWAGLRQYGYVTRTKVTGEGYNSGIFQTGVRFHAGTRGAVTGSTITDNAWFTGAGPTALHSYGVLLTDAQAGADPDNPAVPAVALTGNAFAGNRIAVQNANADNTLISAAGAVPATGNWWGCTRGPIVGTSNMTVGNANYGCQGYSGDSAAPDPVASVDVSGFSATVPATLSVPAPTADEAPSVAFAEPIASVQLAVGETLAPVVRASDDFGVRSVALFADGAAAGTLARAPYEFSWTPSAADAGRTITLSAVATDAAGQTAVATLLVTVAGGPAPQPNPPVNTAPPLVLGEFVAGKTLSCLPGSWNLAPTAFSYEWLRAGTPIASQTAATYVATRADVASELACRVTAVNAEGAAVATSKPTLVRFAANASGSAYERQVGPAIIALKKSASVSRKSGRAALGSVACVRALAKRCTTTITGTVKVGGKRWKVSGTSTASALELRLPAGVRKALSQRGGTLSLKLTVTDDTGFTGGYSKVIALKRAR